MCEYCEDYEELHNNEYLGIREHGSLGRYIKFLFHKSKLSRDESQSLWRHFELLDSDDLVGLKTPASRLTKNK